LLSGAAEREHGTWQNPLYDATQQRGAGVLRIDTSAASVSVWYALHARGMRSSDETVRLSDSDAYVGRPETPLLDAAHHLTTTTTTTTTTPGAAMHDGEHVVDDIADDDAAAAAAVDACRATPRNDAWRDTPLGFDPDGVLIRSARALLRNKDDF
jgi:hypothetical protein